MNFREVIEQLSKEYSIPLQPTEQGERIQGEVYHIDYLTYPHRPELKPRLVFGQMDSTFGFGGTERKPLIITYYVHTPHLASRLDFFRKSSSTTSQDFLAAFQHTNQPLTKVRELDTRSINVADDDLLPFIKEHVELR